MFFFGFDRQCQISADNFVEEVSASIEEVKGKGKSCCEAETTASEHERRKVRVRSLRKKTKKKVMMNGGGGGGGSCSGSRLSISLSQSLRKRRNKVADCRFASISFNNVCDSKEEEALFVYKTTGKAKGYDFVLFTTRKLALKALQRERESARERSVWMPRK